MILKSSPLTSDKPVSLKEIREKAGAIEDQINALYIQYEHSKGNSKQIEMARKNIESALNLTARDEKSATHNRQRNE